MIKIENGDIYYGEWDMIVIPCSTSGSVTQRIAMGMKKFKLQKPPKGLNLGTVLIKRLNGGENIAKYICYAISVQNNYEYYYRSIPIGKPTISNEEAIENIGIKIGYFTKENNSIHNIVSPALGTGAGGLSLKLSIERLSKGFLSCCSDTSTLNIRVLELSDYLKVKDLNISKNKHLMKNEIVKFDYDIALSFAGEDREIAKRIADKLVLENYRVFYDEYLQASLWGKDLYSHLSEIYEKRARYCLMIISEAYSKKQWTTVERKSAQARAFEQNEEYILPLRLDNTEIPGIQPTVGYVDYFKLGLEQVLELIKQKLNK